MKTALVTLLTSEDPAQQELKEKVQVMGQAVIWSLLSENKSASMAMLSPVNHELVETVVSMFPCIKMEKQTPLSISRGSNLRSPLKIDLAQSDSGRDTSSSTATTPGSLNWSVFDMTPQMLQKNHDEPVNRNEQRRLPKKYTKEQVRKLAEYFKKRHYIPDEDKYQMAKETGLTAQQVSNWFANTRRSLKKKNITF
ncbi:hypothetical protein GCK72_022729 [Caenorhabditis remanei]|uniref:Homeobox domain-containing protein n=1 Tax=Caenorhabditis remanei TaxID=31234 RepID=A0A6A5FUT0_CAERE|nr:hypothetical protein GCK72_022729 [Caenorhabditis remanei]KAF1746276.1 hypothetical protein GCK72_022729 [Caenorhabditis remanei]